MKGTIERLDADTGEIRGDDKVVYGFSIADLEVGMRPEVGQRVVFLVGDNNRAVQIMSTAESLPSSSRRRFEMSNVLELTFSAIGKNAGIFFGAAILLVGLPSLLIGLWSIQFVNNNPYNPYGSASAEIALLGFAGAIVAWIGSVLMQGTVLKAAINGFNGKKTSFGDALATGFGRFLPLVGAGIVVSIGTALGYILLIVPGVILSIIWVLTAPVIVGEKRNVFSSMQRSRDLTRNHRWAIFFLIIVYLIVVGIISAVSNFVGAAVGAAGATEHFYLLAILDAVVAVVLGVLSSAGVSALYFELRSSKEGMVPDQIASIFD